MTLALKFPYPPMEAKTAEKIPEGAEWGYEPKWDGFRCLAESHRASQAEPREDPADGARSAPANGNP